MYILINPYHFGIRIQGVLKITNKLSPRGKKLKNFKKIFKLIYIGPIDGVHILFNPTLAKNHKLIKSSSFI